MSSYGLYQGRVISLLYFSEKSLQQFDPQFPVRFTHGFFVSQLPTRRIINYDAFAKLLAHLSVFCLVEPQLAQTRTQVAMKRWSLLSPCFLWMFNTSVESLSNTDQRRGRPLICHTLNYLPPISLALAVYRRDYFAMLICFFFLETDWLEEKQPDKGISYL